MHHNVEVARVCTHRTALHRPWPGLDFGHEQGIDFRRSQNASCVISGVGLQKRHSLGFKVQCLELRRLRVSGFGI